MSEIAVFNPTARRKSRKHRSPAQKAATRKMLAARWGRNIARKTSRRRTAKKNPVRRSRPSARRASAAGRMLRRARRNPSSRFGLGNFFKGTLMPGLIGAGGAIGLDLALNMLPLPATIKTGPFRPVVRIAGAIGIGMLGGMVLGRRTGEQITAGAVTVVLYDTLKGYLRPMFPALGAYDEPTLLGYENAALFSPDMGEEPMPAQMGVYDQGMGEDDLVGVYTQ